MKAYGIYRNTRDNAWKCLIDFKIDSLPVDVLKIAQGAGIRVIKNSDANALSSDENGRSYFDGEQWYIIYDDSAPVELRRFTVAHELGHCFLGHEAKLIKYSHIRQISYTAASEKQADQFAMRLLCPACVLWGLGITTTEEIASVCRVDMSVAEKRLKRLKELYARNKFFTSPLEKEVFSMFEEYLNRKNSLFF